jgi:hypothetical protein
MVYSSWWSTYFALRSLPLQEDSDQRPPGLPSPCDGVQFANSARFVAHYELSLIALRIIRCNHILRISPASRLALVQALDAELSQW